MATAWLTALRIGLLMAFAFRLSLVFWGLTVGYDGLKFSASRALATGMVCRL